MRLGVYETELIEGSIAAACYGTQRIAERHRHRYEFNPAYRDRIESAGLRIAGTSLDDRLVEVIELTDHPWFVGVQFHPEFSSRLLSPHPLFCGFVRSCLEQRASSRSSS
jgi:CTP synthase